MAKGFFLLAILSLPCMRYTLYRNFQWTDLFGCLAIGLWGADLLRQRRLPFVSKEPTLLFSLFLLSVGVSLVGTGITQEGLFGFLQLLYFFFFFLIAQDLLQTERDVRLTCVAWAFGVVYTLLFGFFAMGVGIEDRFGYWIKDFGFQGLFQSRSFCGAYLSLSLLGGAGCLAGLSLRRILKPFAGLGLLALWAALLLTRSVSVYLATWVGAVLLLRRPGLFLVTLGLFLLVANHLLPLRAFFLLHGMALLFLTPKEKWLIPLVAALVLFMLWVPRELGLRFQEVEESGSSRSFDFRARLNAASLYAAFHHPLGSGLEVLSSNTEAKRALPFMKPLILHSSVHNTYLKVLSETGWLSAFFYLAFLTAVLLRWPQKAAPKHPTFLNALASSRPSLFTALATALFLEPGLYWRFGWVLFGIGLSRLFQTEGGKREATFV